MACTRAFPGGDCLASSVCQGCTDPPARLTGKPSKILTHDRKEEIDTFFDDWVTAHPEHPLSKAVAIYKYFHPNSDYGRIHTTSAEAVRWIMPDILQKALSGLSLEDASQSVLAELVAVRLEGGPVPAPTNSGQGYPGASSVDTFEYPYKITYLNKGRDWLPLPEPEPERPSLLGTIKNIFIRSKK